MGKRRTHSIDSILDWITTPELLAERAMRALGNMRGPAGGKSSAPGMFLDLFRQFFDFFRLFDQGDGKDGGRIRFFDFVLELSGKIKEFLNVLLYGFLVLLEHGLGSGAGWVVGGALGLLIAAGHWRRDGWILGEEGSGVQADGAEGG
jgi:hypothetical protein